MTTRKSVRRAVATAAATLLLAGAGAGAAAAGDFSLLEANGNLICAPDISGQGIGGTLDLLSPTTLIDSCNQTGNASGGHH